MLGTYTGEQIRSLSSVSLKQIAKFCVSFVRFIVRQTIFLIFFTLNLIFQNVVLCILRLPTERSAIHFCILTLYLGKPFHSV